jgi:hypothetical protein
MLQVYRGFVEVEGGRAAFAELFRAIADAEVPVLFHCTAGKDRTGWAAALLLHLAGVDDATILEDYLLTNTFSSATREKYLGLVREHLGADKVEVYERLTVADEVYLQTGYDAVTAAYGDRLGYLRDGLGLDDATLSTNRRSRRSSLASPPRSHRTTWWCSGCHRPWPWWGSSCWRCSSRGCSAQAGPARCSPPSWSPPPRCS